MIVCRNMGLPFVGDMPLTAYTAVFDMGALRAAFAWYELPLPPIRYFCTLKLARSAWPELESHAPASLGETFGIACATMP